MSEQNLVLLVLVTVQILQEHKRKKKQKTKGSKLYFCKNIENNLIAILFFLCVFPSELKRTNFMLCCFSVA